MERVSDTVDVVIENLGTAENRPESSDVNADANASHQRGAAWNRPFNGAAETGPVMGGSVSWPALSKSTPAVIRSPSDLCAPNSGGLPSSSFQAPLISQTPQRQASTPNSIPSRTRGRGGRGNGPAIAHQPHHGYNQAYNYPLEHAGSNRSLGGVGASRPYVDTDHSYQRNNSSRRGNFGGRGLHHNNHGGRGRGQPRRDVYHFQPLLQHQYIPPHQHITTYVPVTPPPLPTGASHYMAPTRPFPYDMASTIFLYPPPPPMPPMESYRGMQIIPHQSQTSAPMNLNFGPANGDDLTSRIVRQIDYYFSDHNLETDLYLKLRMNNQGWVPITLVANFPRMQLLTNDIFIIGDALRYSSVVEVQDGMIRRRHGWERWIQPKPLSENNGNSNGNTNGNTV